MNMVQGKLEETDKNRDKETNKIEKQKEAAGG
jgi:hypothetical protein